MHHFSVMATESTSLEDINNKLISLGLLPVEPMYTSKTDAQFINVEFGYGFYLGYRPFNMCINPEDLEDYLLCHSIGMPWIDLYNLYARSP